MYTVLIQVDITSPTISQNILASHTPLSLQLALNVKNTTVGFHGKVTAKNTFPPKI